MSVLAKEHEQVFFMLWLYPLINIVDNKEVSANVPNADILGLKTLQNLSRNQSKVILRTAHLKEY